jgi:ubiquinone biosynthesis protein UbiJ
MSRAYNPAMFEALTAQAGEAVIGRATLLANHVIGAEPAAMERLRPHAGRSLRLELGGWPSLLPPPPALTFVVTPAGLLEWCGADAPASVDLHVGLDASHPIALVAGAALGRRPKVEIAGDAAFAADVNWLAENLRWDVQDDLERLVGPGPAHEIARLARAVAGGLRDALERLGVFAGSPPSR